VSLPCSSCLRRMCAGPGQAELPCWVVSNCVPLGGKGPRRRWKPVGGWLGKRCQSSKWCSAVCCSVWARTVVAQEMGCVGSCPKRLFVPSRSSRMGSSCVVCGCFLRVCPS